MVTSYSIKWLTIGLVTSTLCGCFGGSIAQQLVQSMLMQGADKATSAAIDAHEMNEKIAEQKLPFKGAAPDPLKIVFLNSGFEKVAIQVEPLPSTILEDEKPTLLMEETKLVKVEVWNLLVGDEKQRILENARIQGAADIPPKIEWQQWQIAIGSTENITPSNKKQTITFLIPPEMGKMHSGAKALVELSKTGELNVARYSLN